MFCSNCCFLTCIQETGKILWYSHFFKNFPQFAVIHTEAVVAREEASPISWWRQRWEQDSDWHPRFLVPWGRQPRGTACPPQGGRACWAWTIMPRSQRRGKVGHGGGRSAPVWPATAVRPGSPPLCGVLQPWLQSSPDPLPEDSSRAFAQGLGGTLTGEGLQAQWGPAVGQPAHLGMSSIYVEQLKGMSLLVRAWQNVVHWIRKWQTISEFLPWEPHEQNEKAKRCDTGRRAPRLVGVPIRYWGRAEKQLHKEWRGWAKAETSLSCGCVWWWKSDAVQNNIA